MEEEEEEDEEEEDEEEEKAVRVGAFFRVQNCVSRQLMSTICSYQPMTRSL